MDLVPHVLTAAQREALQVLARRIAEQVEQQQQFQASMSAEKALAESEARFESVVANTPGMVYRFVLHPGGMFEFLFVSKNCREIYGLEPENVQRDPTLILDTLSPEDRAEFASTIAESAQSLQPWNWKGRIVRADGAVRWIQTASLPHRQDNGDVVWDGVLLDVTYHHSVEEVLSERETFLQRSNSILQAQQESAIDGILIVDENRHIVGYNRRLCEMWHTPDEIIQSGDDKRHLGHALSLMAEPDKFLAKVLHLYDHPTESSRDELLLMDGRVLDRYSGPVVGGDGQDYGRVWYFRDITERVRDAEALRESEAILRRANSALLAQQEAGEDGILILNEHRQLVSMNRRFCELWHIPESVAASRDHQVMLSLVVAQVQAQERDKFLSKVLYLYDHPMETSRDEICLNDERILDRYSGPVVGEDGQNYGRIWYFRDVTEQKRAEEALRAGEERLRTVVSGLPLILFALDPVGIITFSDGRGLNALGLKPGEDVGKSMLDLYAGYPEVQIAIRRALAGETVSLIQEFTATVFETQFVPQFDDQSRTLGVIGVAVDVTERRWSERQILDLNSQLEQRLDRIVVLNFELSQAYDATIEGWSRALDLRDHETEGHSLRVTDLTLRLAKEFGLSDDEQVQIRRGALLHDIGKMGIPDAILLKPGPLTDEERTVMQRHPAFALEMLSPVVFLRPALEIPFCHHEKWDGTGYPNGLIGEDIPLSARLFAIVDVWDALRSDRPYRRAWSVEKTRAHIMALTGTHFDPQVVHRFLKIVDSQLSD